MWYRGRWRKRKSILERQRQRSLVHDMLELDAWYGAQSDKPMPGHSWIVSDGSTPLAWLLAWEAVATREQLGRSWDDHGLVGKYDRGVMVHAYNPVSAELKARRRAERRRRK